jgi:hypothetical protein
MRDVITCTLRQDYYGEGIEGEMGWARGTYRRKKKYAHTTFSWEIGTKEAD